jgi:hypothetical protein
MPDTSNFTSTRICLGTSGTRQSGQRPCARIQYLLTCAVAARTCGVSIACIARRPRSWNAHSLTTGGDLPRPRGFRSETEKRYGPPMNADERG